MEHHVCPWYIGYLLASPLRRLFQNPEDILSPFLKEGMTVLEIGPGMGFFSIPMAKIVGANGKIICIDLQDKMIAGLVKRAAKAGISNRIETRVCTSESLRIDDLKENVDAAILFAVIHELPDQRHLFEQLYPAVKKGGLLLIAEPTGHVTEEAFKSTLSIAAEIGFKHVQSPVIKKSHTAILKKT
jgi:ubiquinone/menaquinone biosynthesis C-methylase UbiE